MDHVGLVTESAANLPPEYAARHGVEIVPLTVTIAGAPFLEGEELDADTFYARLEHHSPEVSTSQPSPGQFADAYRALAEQGVQEILSIHAGASVSGTVNAARLAAPSSPVPVRVVDTGTISFGVACCVLEAADALERGAPAAEAAALAERVGATVGSVFVVAALDLARAGGRLAPDAEADGIPVMTMTGGVMEVIATATDATEAAEAMAARIRPAGTSTTPLRVGVGVADPAAKPLGDTLEWHLAELPEVAEVLRYRVGPSVGAHTGPGTVGAMFYPRPSLAG